MAENAWMDVGRLSEGHILYRLSEDGKSYDLVPITSIQVQRAEAQPVYGIHLREGERSYHANGYLVSVNYPEITIKSVARALKALPRKQRADMLVKIKELAPVFSKLGIQGVSDLLSREIRQNIKKKRNFTGPRRRKGYRGINFLDLKRTYALEAKDAPKTNKEGPPGYTLPQVSVYEGSLVVDDDVVPRATLDGSNGTIQWSRELPDFGYEHGMMEFDPTSVGTVGRGAVLVSEASDPEWDADSLRQVVPFTFEKSMRTNPVPRMTKTAQTLESRVPTFPIIDNDEDDSITDVDWWHVSVDSVPWSTDEGEDKTEFTAPWSFGNVGVGLYHSRPTNGVVVPVVLFKRLDDLRDKINATRLEDEKLGPLYNQEFSINSEGNWVGRVMFKRAGELAFLSDQYTGNPGGFPDTPPTERLTYRNFGYPYRIQHLFSLCEWEWSWDNRTLRGAMYKFDPAMREELGDK